MSFLEKYEVYDSLSLGEKKNIIEEVKGFFEEKAIMYIVSNLKNDVKIDKEPVAIRYQNEMIDDKNVSFGNNVIIINEEALLEEDKSSLFYAIAQNTVCAVFLCLFSNTASNPNKKTSFSKLSSSFTASIAGEFALGTAFAQDIMNSFAMEMTESVEMSAE